MFEDSLVESRVSHASSAERLTALASITFQCAFAMSLVALPLLHPERLVPRVPAPPVLIPLPHKPPIRIERSHVSSAPSNLDVPLLGIAGQSDRPSLVARQHPPIDDAPPTSFVAMNMTNGSPVVLAVETNRHGTRVSIASTSATSRPVRISAGVSAGMLMVPIRPIYPPIAKAAGVQGTVVVEAVISRTGKIDSLRVVSGPPMLRAAAVDAIQAARYQPYRLNSEPTDVETTITVNFRMGGSNETCLSAKIRAAVARVKILSDFHFAE